MTTGRAVNEPVFRCCLFCRRLRWPGQAGGRLGHLGAARRTQEHAASPWDFLRTGASVWWLSCCSAIRLPACSPGASLAFSSGRLRWAMWSTLGEKMGQWRRLGIRTPYALYAGGGVLHRRSGGGPLRVIKSFFRAVFCGIPSSIGVAPTIMGLSKPRVLGWDENTPSSK